MPGSRKSITPTSGLNSLHAPTAAEPSETAADHLDPLLQLEQELERLAEDVVVLDEQDADRLGPEASTARDHKRYSAERRSG